MPADNQRRVANRLVVFSARHLVPARRRTFDQIALRAWHCDSMEIATDDPFVDQLRIMACEGTLVIDRHILHRGVGAGLLYQGTIAQGRHHSIHNRISGDRKVRPNRTVYSGVMVLYRRYAVHSPEVQAFTSSPSIFQTRPKPRLVGIVVDVPWRKLTFHVESADFT